MQQLLKLPICEIFRTKKLNCLTIIQKQKVFILVLSLNNSKLFRIKFRRSIKHPLIFF